MMVNNTNNIKKTMYLRLTSTWSSNYITPQPEAGTTYFSCIHRFAASDYPFGIFTPFLSEAVWYFHFRGTEITMIDDDISDRLVHAVTHLIYEYSDLI